jgi:hypothetical protein
MMIAERAADAILDRRPPEPIAAEFYRHDPASATTAAAS